ncbi:FAD dependent oxidoreductase [Fragilaria crotonensis]|nr:FAD dependent oxidoreductase [Fragilaria crotonensis]
MIRRTNHSATNRVEAVVIGAGVIGLAVARALALKGKEVIIVERASTIGSETSSRNSEVIHAGIYYPTSSRKAQFCVEGKKMLYELCHSHSIPVRRCGKLIIATQEQQFQTNLVQLKEQAIRNGVDDVRLLSSDDVSILEPEVTSVGGALYSPSTGVLDSHSFLQSLLADAEYHKATLLLRTGVERGSVPHDDDDDQVITLQIDGMDLQCDTVINCAGLAADKIAANLHKSTTKWQPPRHYFAKGNYFRLQGTPKPPFQHLVYPVPEPGGLGVHATIDWMGQSTKFGPDVQWIDPSVRLDDIDLSPDPSRSNGFYEQVRKYWPNLPDDSIVSDYAGLRPKLYHPLVRNGGSAPFLDFLIAEPKDHGVPGLFHLLGIESPGLTASMSIANYIAERS